MTSPANLPPRPTFLPRPPKAGHHVPFHTAWKEGHAVGPVNVPWVSPSEGPDSTIIRNGSGRPGAPIVNDANGDDEGKPINIGKEGPRTYAAKEAHPRVYPRQVPVNQLFVPPSPSTAVKQTSCSPSLFTNTYSSLPLKPGGDSTYAGVDCAGVPDTAPDWLDAAPASTSAMANNSSSLALRTNGSSAIPVGKRKHIEDDNESISSNINTRVSSTSGGRRPALDIPTLPLPIPSKRFKKGPTSKSVLLPVETLPVYPLPPVPPIKDADLLETVFTHCSLFEKAKGRFEEPEENPAKHYEKLEHVGDSVLGMIVTTWLHELRPRLTCGTATKLKAHLVSNATLSHLSGLYGFPQRLKGDPNLLPVLRSHTDVRAALMEAYIAGLYFSFPPHERLSLAMPILDTWLREMYDPLVDFFFDHMKTQYDTHNAAVGAAEDGSIIIMSEKEMERIDQAAKGMAPLVQMYATQQDRELRWEQDKLETSIGILWEIRCVIDGVELGKATRAGKRAGKNVAAWEAAKKLGLVIA